MNTPAEDTAGRSAGALLEKLHVLELGARVGAGACGGLLAQLGAEVILVEPVNPCGADKWQNRPAMAAGKSSIVIDDASADGRQELVKLLAGADVVLLSSDLSSTCDWVWNAPRPRQQIICDITAFGHSGPMAGKPLPEALVQAYSAVADTMGESDGPPAFIGAPLLDMEAAAYAAAAIIAARRVVRQHGFGQRIEIALYDVAVNSLLTFIPMYLVGKASGRNGNRHPTLVPWNAYKAKDGWVLICGPTNDQWRRICEALEQPALAAEARFSSPTLRMDNVAEVDAAINLWTASRSVSDCVARFNQFGIPSGSIVSIEDVTSEPNLVHRGMVFHQLDPVSGSMVQTSASPIRMRGIKPAAPLIPQVDGQRQSLLAQRSVPAGTTEETRGDLQSPHRPLEGVRVVEIGMNTVAPLACRQLGALGADVIKVEPPTGDTNRWNAPLHASGESYVFALSNTDKRGVVLDLRRAEDKETLFALLATADMVIENLKPGSLEKLGVGAADVLARFPNLIYCSVNGFGYESVYPGRPALDTVIQGMSGVMSASIVNGVPTKAGISVSDQLGGQLGLVGMLAALDRKERTGRGANFDIAMQDCSAWSTQMLWRGNKHTAQSSHIVATSDGYVAIHGDLQAGAHLLGGAAGESLEEVARRLARDEVVRLLQSSSSLQCVPVLGIAEVFADPQLAARELFVERHAADGIAWKVLSSPMRLRSTPAVVSAPMPRLGYPDQELQAELRCISPAVSA
jgi:crotonobetainyl-CoA:carnitine CoA-transferase CaiB-like acyl-CoA transferase